MTACGGSGSSRVRCAVDWGALARAVRGCPRASAPCPPPPAPSPLCARGHSGLSVGGCLEPAAGGRRGVPRPRGSRGPTPAPQRCGSPVSVTWWGAWPRISLSLSSCRPSKAAQPYARPQARRPPGGPASRTPPSGSPGRSETGLRCRGRAGGSGVSFPDAAGQRGARGRIPDPVSSGGKRHPDPRRPVRRAGVLPQGASSPASLPAEAPRAPRPSPRRFCRVPSPRPRAPSCPGCLRGGPRGCRCRRSAPVSQGLRSLSVCRSLGFIDRLFTVTTFGIRLLNTSLKFTLFSRLSVVLPQSDAWS